MSPHRRPTDAEFDAALTHEQPHRGAPAWLNGVWAACFLYLFLSAINVMGSGLKAIGKSSDWLETLLAHGSSNPLIALFGAVLITAIVQSSSFTTSLIITLVASGQLDIGTAVYAVMGANIGTSVTNIIVSLGNVRIRRQFRRAFTAALVHDIFNWLTVAMLFPLEWITSAFLRIRTADGEAPAGILGWASKNVADLMGLGELEKGTSPVKAVTKPVVDAVKWLVQQFTDDPIASGGFIAIAGLVLLFVSLVFMVRNLKGALLRRIEGLFRRIFFRNDGVAYIVGAITTIMVQSSSITTSLIVPLAGAGAVKIKRVFPYTLGANLGTTMTGVIAATANPVAAAVAVAIAHVTFNLIGTVVWYPLRRVPIGLARWYGKLASESRRYAILFLAMVFGVIPVVAIAITELILRLLGAGGP